MYTGIAASTIQQEKPRIVCSCRFGSEQLMFVTLKNAGKHVLYIAQVIRSMYSNIIGACTTVRVARRFYRKFNPTMEPIKVVQLLNLSNGVMEL